MTKRPVSIGSRKLYAELKGAGPVVVLEPGAAGGGTYGGVIDAVAEFATVLAYDRAGVRDSDPPAADATVEDITNDLHNLLSAMPIERPIILVGWSLTGLSALIHPLLYPEDIRGVVLIDPTPFTLFDNPEWAGALKDPKKAVRNAKVMARLGYGKWWGTGGMANWLRENCGPDVNEEALKEYAWSLTNLSRFGAMGELRQIRQSCQIARELNGRQTFPDIPLKILSAEVDTSISPDAARAKHAIHKHMAQLNAQGEYRLVDGGSHMMTLDRPDAIVMSIQDVIAETD